MNQRGFATILGLCLILAIALAVRGIHEAEMNHGYEVADFRAEFDLQNAADNALIEAANKVISGEIELPFNDNPNYHGSRLDHQYRIIWKTKTSAYLKSIRVRVWGERIAIQPYEVTYKTDEENAASEDRNIAKKSGDPSPSYVFFSVAEATNQHTGGKIYRRAYAYVPVGGTTIHFMEVPMSSYKFK